MRRHAVMRVREMFVDVPRRADRVSDATADAFRKLRVEPVKVTHRDETIVDAVRLRVFRCGA